ncbi:hypothetical protein ACQCP8_25905, partial [Ralstonia pseudosolanacearum]|uniref:hypothetical protein n=1 Tax=Ralstonia pseudosolanacearum TaxID=1310165 RepID=UPI003CEB8794
QADADAAALDASQALSAASTATTKASEAAQSASDAATAKTAAQTAQTAAEGSATTAQTAAQTATAKAAEAAESARTLTIDTTLTQSGQAADAKATGAVRDDLKTYLLDKFETVEPVNWFDSEHITTGQYIAASGTVYENSGYFCTDYIPVAEGDEILACRGNGSFAALYT